MIIKKYSELVEYIRMFKRQNADLLIIMSRAGLGKTSILKEVMGKDDYVYVSTHSTPLQTYITLWEKADLPIVFDDLDALFKSPILVSLFKALTDTSQVKELHYDTTSKLIGNAPPSFKTTSNACVLLNEFDVNKKELQPLLDRGHYIEFSPSKEEILNKIREISRSQNIAHTEMQVFEFIEQNYKKIDKLSIRTYIKALQLFRDNPRKWRERFMQMVGFDEKVIEYLKLKDKYESIEQMVKNYNWSRATFFRIRSEVEGG